MLSYVTNESGRTKLWESFYFELLGRLDQSSSYFLNDL